MNQQLLKVWLVREVQLQSFLSGRVGQTYLLQKFQKTILVQELMTMENSSAKMLNRLNLVKQNLWNKNSLKMDQGPTTLIRLLLWLSLGQSLLLLQKISAKQMLL